MVDNRSNYFSVGNAIPDAANQKIINCRAIYILSKPHDIGNINFILWSRYLGGIVYGTIGSHPFCTDAVGLSKIDRRKGIGIEVWTGIFGV